MAIVNWMVNSVDGYLAGIGETNFGVLASPVGVVGGLMATLAVAIVALNGVMQYRAVDFRTTLMTILKLAFIAIFSTNWAQFNIITDAIISASTNLATLLMSSLGGPGDASPGYFANEFDILVNYLTKVLNAAGASMNWVGGAVFLAIGALLLGLMAMAAGFIICFAKIMLTFYVGIAPLMIILSIFPITADYFRNWLSGIISYAFYPVILAAVFSVVLGMVNQMIDRMGDPETASSLGQLMPFLVMILLCLACIAVVPMLVRQISGNVALLTPLSAPMTALSLLAAARLAGVTRMLSQVLSRPTTTAAGAAPKAVAAATGGGSATSAAARLARSNRLSGRP